MTGPTPHRLGDENRHYWLAKKMAALIGADLQAALEAGQIDHTTWSDAVTRCRGCSWDEGCQAWMDSQAAGQADVPQACPNAELFERVLRLQDKDDHTATPTAAE